MKKKLLLIVSMLAVLVCLLAVCVSAETVLKAQDNNAYGELSLFDESVTVGRTNTKYGFTPYINAEGTTYARIVVGDGTTFYTFPTAYALSNSDIWGDDSHGTVYFLNFTSLNTAMAEATGTNPGWTYKNIYRIEMPYRVTYLNGGNEQSFQDYTNIIEIFLQPNSSVKDQGKTMIFWKCNNLETIHNLDTFVFKKGCLGGSFQNCAKLTSLTIGVSSEVTDTGDNLFNGCTNLQSVNFVEAFPNLQTIGKNSFYNCENLQNFSSGGQSGAYVMQSSVTTIKQEAFFNCKAMKYISISPAVSSIEKLAFKDCRGLVFVDFNDNQNEFNVDVYGQFLNCTSLLAVSLPDNYKYIPNQMFKGCSALSTVYLPKNLTRIDTNGWGDDPFNGCTYLYFVQEAFEVRDENGNFYSAETFVKPTKPDVYYMPSTLSALCTNKTSGKCFTGSYNLNPIIVFGENMTKTTLGDGIFYECGNNGTLGSGITVVFLGDMEQLKVHPRDNRNKGVKYVFANANDKSITDVDVISNTTNGYNLNDKTEGFYFCHGNCYYLFDGIKYSGTYTDTTLTKVTEAKHVYAIVSATEPTCTVDGVNGYKCFCGKASDTAETVPALGHQKSEVKAITYNGVAIYFEKGDITYKCGRCEENHTVEDDAEALFNALGYTHTEAGKLSKAIMQSFGVNRKAIEKYNEYTENDIVDYGVMAATENGLAGVNDVFGDNGEANTAKVNVASYFGKSFDLIEMKLGGLEGKDGVSYEDAKLYCCAFIQIANGEKVDSYYATKGEGSAVIGTELSNSVSYNELVA